MKWFDTETGEILTEADMRREYWAWLCARITEDGETWAAEHPADYTFEVYEENCTTAWNGTLIRILPTENR